MNRPDFTVSTLGELTTLITTDLAEGCNVWVDADGAYWTLQKGSGAAPSPTVIAPLPGAPSAGANDARWVREAGASALTGDVIGSFTANFSTLDHADQFVGPGNCAITTLAPVRPYVILPKDVLARDIELSYEGDAANNTGPQTMEVAPQFSTDHGATWNDISGMRFLLLPTNLTGFHGVQIVLGTPQLLPAGTLLSLVLHPSAALQGTIKNLSAVIAT